MKSFRAFINESTWYRGISSKEGNGSSPFVWYTDNKDLAKEYSNLDISDRKTRDGKVISISYNPKYSFDARDADRRISVSSFLAEVMKQSKVDFKKISKEGSRLRKEIISKFGKDENYINQYWQDENVAKFIDLLGFDSVVAKESGNQTIGILKRYT